MEFRWLLEENGFAQMDRHDCPPIGPLVCAMMSPPMIRR